MAALVAVLLVLGGGVTWVALRQGGQADQAAPGPAATEPAPAASASPTFASPPAPWLSGASGVGVADGSYAAWRGSPLDISDYWADNNQAMVELYQLQPGGEFADWDQALDVAVGAIDEDAGESWAQAATGAYDARWRTSLENLEGAWAGRPGQLYVRFAHEMNGNWYPWRVTAADKDAFVASWKRFRALQQEVFPASKLVFCLNRESVESGFDWRESFPGADQVDVLGVDYYNQFPDVATAEDWEASMSLTDEWGGPKGLDGYLDFARSVGLPLAVPEWSGNAEMVDSPVFVDEMNAFFGRHGGTGPGQLLYEVQFNVDQDDRRWLLFGDTRMPESAAEYRRLTW